MALNQEQSLQQRIKSWLTLFFSDTVYSETRIEDEITAGNIVFKPADILPFLQTSLLDDKIVEVEMNGITQVYFSRIYDDLPELSDASDERPANKEVDDYSPGDYLKKLSHLIILPLEPGMGNFNIRYASRILLRFFTTTYAVELGTFFQDLGTVHNLPVLRLDYPVIGRIVRGSREYRAKVPERMDMVLMVIGKRKQKSFSTRLTNISASGFAFAIDKEQQDIFKIEETRTFEIQINKLTMLRLNGVVRHISKIRGKKGTEYQCGIKADLVTRAIAAKLEEIVATVQRAHLREISDLSDESGIKLLT